MSVYSDPYALGLYPLAEMDLSEPDYSFNIVAVWRHEDGRLFWATDSGCSCPSPFEDYHTLESLEQLSRYDYPQVEKMIKQCENRGTLEAAHFLREVKAAIEML